MEWENAISGPETNIAAFGTLDHMCNASESVMESTSLPSLRVTPEFRNEAESVLRPGETLRGFVEDSVRRNIRTRQIQQEFISRGLAAREEAKRTGQYASTDDVMNSLRGILEETTVPTERVRLGSLLVSIAEEAGGLTDEEHSVFDRLRDKTRRD